MEAHTIRFDIMFDAAGNIMNAQNDQVKHKFTLELLALKPMPQSEATFVARSVLCREHIDILDGDAGKPRGGRRTAKAAVVSHPRLVQDFVGVPAALKSIASDPSVCSSAAAASSRRSTGGSSDVPKHILK